MRRLSDVHYFDADRFETSAFLHRTDVPSWIWFEILEFGLLAPILLERWNFSALLDRLLQLVPCCSAYLKPGSAQYLQTWFRIFQKDPRIREVLNTKSREELDVLLALLLRFGKTGAMPYPAEVVRLAETESVRATELRQYENGLWWIAGLTLREILPHIESRLDVAAMLNLRYGVRRILEKCMDPPVGDCERETRLQVIQDLVRIVSTAQELHVDFGDLSAGFVFQRCWKVSQLCADLEKAWKESGMTLFEVDVGQYFNSLRADGMRGKRSNGLDVLHVRIHFAGDGVRKPCLFRFARQEQVALRLWVDHLLRMQEPWSVETWYRGIEGRCSEFLEKEPGET